MLLRVQRVTSVKDASRLKCIPNNWRVLYKSTGGFLPVAYTDFLTIITQIKLARRQIIFTKP